MVAKILNMLAFAFAYASSWFVSVMNETRMLGMFLFGFFVFNLVRLIIRPLVGAASSDLARKAVKFKDYS